MISNVNYTGNFGELTAPTRVFTVEGDKSTVNGEQCSVGDGVGIAIYQILFNEHGRLIIREAARTAEGRFVVHDEDPSRSRELQLEMS